jgi:hypothetical protein
LQNALCVNGVRVRESKLAITGRVQESSAALRRRIRWRGLDHDVAQQFDQNRVIMNAATLYLS